MQCTVDGRYSADANNTGASAYGSAGGKRPEHLHRGRRSECRVSRLISYWRLHVCVASAIDLFTQAGCGTVATHAPSLDTMKMKSMSRRHGLGDDRGGRKIKNEHTRNVSFYL